MKRLMFGLVLLAGLAPMAWATLVLTVAGTAENLVVTQYSTGHGRVFGMGFDSSGKVFATNGGGFTFVFPNDTDGHVGDPGGVS